MAAFLFAACPAARAAGPEFRCDLITKLLASAPTARDRESLEFMLAFYARGLEDGMILAEAHVNASAEQARKMKHDEAAGWLAVASKRVHDLMFSPPLSPAEFGSRIAKRCSEPKNKTEYLSSVALDLINALVEQRESKSTQPP